MYDLSKCSALQAEKSVSIKVTGNYKRLIGLIMSLYLDGYLGESLDDTVKYLKMVDKKFSFAENSEFDEVKK